MQVKLGVTELFRLYTVDMFGEAVELKGKRGGSLWDRCGGSGRGVCVCEKYAYSDR